MQSVVLSRSTERATQARYVLTGLWLRYRADGIGRARSQASSSCADVLSNSAAVGWEDKTVTDHTPCVWAHAWARKISRAAVQVEWNEPREQSVQRRDVIAACAGERRGLPLYFCVWL